MDGEGTEPSQELDGREALTPVFADLNRYEATTHFNGQSTIMLDGDRAIGESFCLAHHLYVEDGERRLMVASLRYHDRFVKRDGAWLFAERKLYVDWTETRTAPVGVDIVEIVSDNPDEERYEATVDGALAGFVAYRSRPGLIAFIHTEVDDAFEGHGVGSAVVSEALEDARRRELEVLPFCPFVNSYIQQHTEFVDLVPQSRREAFGL